MKEPDSRKTTGESTRRTRAASVLSVIGIDPDVERSGVAVLVDTAGRRDGSGLSMFLDSPTFPELCDNLCTLAYGAGKLNLTVVVEKGWFTQTNYHLRGKGQRYAARQGVDVGRNHETGRKIIEMAEHYGLKVVAVNPLPKVWRGNGGKITTEELERHTGVKFGRCNQDQRDAALLAYSYYQDIKNRLL